MKPRSRDWLLSVIVLQALLALPLLAGESPQAADPQQETETAAPDDTAATPTPPAEEPPPRPADDEPMEQVSADNNLTFPVDI